MNLVVVTFLIIIEVAGGNKMLDCYYTSHVEWDNERKSASYICYQLINVEGIVVTDADSCGPDIKYVGTHQILLHVLKPNMSERMSLLMISTVSSTQFP